MMRRAICKTSDVPENGIKQFDELCVLNAGDAFYACQAKCPHEGIALCEGAFDGEVLTCLEHLWQWRVREGGEPQGLAEGPLTMFPVEVEDGTVYLID
jgi:toluene monooxygenase system ferredoxin subunit